MGLVIVGNVDASTLRPVRGRIQMAQRQIARWLGSLSGQTSAGCVTPISGSRGEERPEVWIGAEIIPI